MKWQLDNIVMIWWACESPSYLLKVGSIGNVLVNSEILVVCLGTCGQPQCNLWDVVQIKKFLTGAAMLP